MRAITLVVVWWAVVGTGLAQDVGRPLSLDVLEKYTLLQKEMSKAKADSREAVRELIHLRVKAGSCSYEALWKSVLRDTSKQLEKASQAQRGLLKLEGYWFSVITQKPSNLASAIKKDLSSGRFSSFPKVKLSLEAACRDIEALCAKAPSRSSFDIFLTRKEVIVSACHRGLAFEDSSFYVVISSQALEWGKMGIDTEKQAECRKLYVEFIDRAISTIESLQELNSLMPE